MNIKGQYLIPFDPQTGDMKAWSPEYAPENPGMTGKRTQTEWRENSTFEAVLQFRGYNRGRSSIKFEFENLDTNTKCEMFLKEFAENIVHMHGGILSGLFTYVNRGGNYGIHLISARRDL